jgi:sugar/nucleoside kinase (ribokinase family)
MPSRYAYLIQRTDPGRDDDRRVMSRGTLPLDDDADTAAAARALLAENRAAHSYYDGPRRCWVWPIGYDETVPRVPPAGVTPVDG